MDGFVVVREVYKRLTPHGVLAGGVGGDGHYVVVLRGWAFRQLRETEVVGVRHFMMMTCPLKATKITQIICQLINLCFVCMTGIIDLMNL